MKATSAVEVPDAFSVNTLARVAMSVCILISMNKLIDER